MDAIHNNWLNAQASRRYPLDDNATGTGDDGRRLKDDVIVDLHMRWPSIAGAYAFLGGVTVSKKIVTAVIMAADSLDAAGGFTPLAAISVTQPAKDYTYYNFDPLYPGVGGFIAFGDVKEAFNIRFSTPRQGLITPKCGRAYSQLPIPSMRKFGRVDGLTGLVRILAGPDLEIVKEGVNVDGIEMDALVIRLAAPTTTRNPLADYIGPCGKRPESRNCDRPGIQTINGVSPDCDGDIEIEFVGLRASPYESCGSDGAGVTIDQSLGLAQVCPARNAERFTGSDYCNPTDESSLSLSSEGGGGGETSSESSEGNNSSEAVPCEDIPFLDCFDTGLHPSWSLKGGAYGVVRSDSPEEACPTIVPCVRRNSGFSSLSSLSSHTSLASLNSLSSVAVPWTEEVQWGRPWQSVSSLSCSVMISQALQLSDTSRRNLIIWEDCGTGYSSNKRITTQVQLTNNGVMQNAGVLMNYRLVNPLTNPQIRYFLAQINRNANTVELYSYNGMQLVLENSVSVGTPFSLNDWYEIEATVTDEISGKRISIRVSGVSVPTWPAVSFNLLTNRWGESVGHHGLHTMQAASNFSYWRLDDA